MIDFIDSPVKLFQEVFVAPASFKLLLRVQAALLQVFADIAIGQHGAASGTAAAPDEIKGSGPASSRQQTGEESPANSAEGQTTGMLAQVDPPTCISACGVLWAQMVDLHIRL
jgi:hypothetical protein